ncbi:MAG: lysine--tRNA ligase [Actinomycetota bacterium]
MTTGHNYPYAYERTATAAQLQQRYGPLDAGTDTGDQTRVAGRLRTVRVHGKVAFADLEDVTGRIQLFARYEELGDDGMAAFESLTVGDVVGASGEVVKTRRGELSVKLEDLTLLAKCLRPMPEKWHGMTDVETRFRQRYLDLIVNPSARRVVEARAVANTVIRRFFTERGFVEVETPLLQQIASGAVARPFVTHHNALDIDLYLRVAPELFLKRLLIGGLERVFELNRSFRNEGVGAQYNPEFTMLEAYEAYVDFEHTMALVEDLVREIAGEITEDLRVEFAEETVDISQPFRRTTMFEAIAEHSGEDLGSIWQEGDQDALSEKARALGVRVDEGWSAGKLLLEIFESVVEKRLQQPTFVAGFPKDVSPLAKDHRSIEGFTEHADLIIRGVEIAPVYSELNDPEEQRRRFEQQARARAAGDDEAMLRDEDFLEALEYGMPPAGGFGLGVDRLLTVLLGLPSLREVILFPTLRPE